MKPAAQAKPREQDRRRPSQGGSSSQAFQAARRQVQQIIDSLQSAYEEMEQVQRLLEQVEHERGEDSRELESLRRTLDRLQSPRSDLRSRSAR